MLTFCISHVIQVRIMPKTASLPCNAGGRVHQGWQAGYVAEQRVPDSHLLQMRLPPQWCSPGCSHGKREGIGLQIKVFNLTVQWKCTRPDICSAVACIA